jgi:spore protease
MQNNKKMVPRTDLAIEAREMVVTEENEPAIKGFIVKEHTINNIEITEVLIEKEAEEKVGKKAGSYWTIDFQSIRDQEIHLQQKAEEVFSQTIREFLTRMNIDKKATCLVVGLGNEHVTPDALGPLVCDHILVTRHLFTLQPESVDENMRSVCAVAPGVMGVTGIETSDVLFGVVQKVRPDFMIVVDALASRSIERVNTTIQITDTGIHPGSGVGNKRKEISKETLGIPVMAIGIPTVVDAVSIVSDAMDMLLKHLGRERKENKKPSHSLVPSGMPFGKKNKYTPEDLPEKEEVQSYLGMVGLLDEEEKRQLIFEVLNPLGQNLMVTPKEVDGFIQDMANLVATGLNSALHGGLGEDPGFHTK